MHESGVDGKSYSLASEYPRPQSGTVILSQASVPATDAGADMAQRRAQGTLFNLERRRKKDGSSNPEGRPHRVFGRHRPGNKGAGRNDRSDIRLGPPQRRLAVARRESVGNIAERDSQR